MSDDEKAGAGRALRDIGDRQRRTSRASAAEAVEEQAETTADIAKSGAEKAAGLAKAGAEAQRRGAEAVDEAVPDAADEDSGRTEDDITTPV